MSAEAVAVDEKPDLEVIVPEEGVVHVRYVEYDKDGLTVKEEESIECRVRRLKTIEFLALMKVLTRGLGGGLTQVKLNLQDPQAAAQDMAALMMLALPEAGEEFVSFLTKIVVPVDAKKASRVKVALANPELDLLPEVIEVVATQERDDLTSLAGKVQAMWSRLQEMYSQRENPTK